jgi:hypothetical protein
LILPLSSWAYWAGLFSNASEIHVNSPPLHPIMYTRSQYIYHAERGNAFFGIYNRTLNDIEYAITTEGVKTHLYPLKSLQLKKTSSSEKHEEHHQGNSASNSSFSINSSGGGSNSSSSTVVGSS